MNRSRSVAIALLALALVIPSAGAWSMFGQKEPDTFWDRTEGRMFLTPDTSPTGAKVYFNGMVRTANAGTNPNVATQVAGFGATRNFQYGSGTFEAYLGVWKDCNKDGYLGNVETALFDYRSEVLALPNTAGVTPGTSVCPVTPRDPVTDAPVHNDGTWVKEFLAIGMVDPCSFEPTPKRQKDCGNIGAFTRNPDVLLVNGTKVWLDSGAPGERGRGTCPVTPFPSGTTSSTGGLLYYLDCLDGRNGAKTVNEIEAATPGDTGLAFEDPNQPGWSSSALNQPFPVNLWGNPYNNQSGLVQNYNPASDRYAYEPAFEVTDCSKPRTDIRDPTAGATGSGSLNQVGVKAPAGTPAAATSSQGYLGGAVNFTDDNGVLLGFYGFDPRTGKPTGSYLAGLDDANDGVYVNFGYNIAPNPALNQNFAPASYQAQSSGDCDRNTNNTVHRNLGTSQEAAFEPANERPKFENWNMATFSNGGRGISADVDKAAGTRTWPGDLGIGAQRHRAGQSWNAIIGLLAANQAFDRYTLKFHPAFYYSYYAYIPSTGISALGLVLPPTAVGTYGVEACPGGIGTGAPTDPTSFWDCDPANWYKDVTGLDTQRYYSDRSPGNSTAIGATIGDAFTLRDVDCYDGSIGQGIYTHPLGQIYSSDTRPCRT